MPNPFGKRSGDTRDTGNEGARKRNEQPLVQQLIGVRQHALNLPKSVLPKVFLVKRRNICVSHSGSPAGGSRPLIGSNLRNRRFPTLAVLRASRHDAVGHIGRIGLLGRRLTPLAQRFRPSPLQGSFKLPSLQTSKLPNFHSACASTPKICITLRNLRFPFWQSCVR